MKNRYCFVLLSRHSLTESMARQQIATLVNSNDGIMCPDKWGTFEPLRTPFDPEDISDPVRRLARPQGDFDYRKGKPIQLSGEIYNRIHPPTARFPSPLFTIYWVGRFEGRWVDRVGIQTVQECVYEMFRASGADFGFLTTEIDLESKNKTSQSHSYRGLTFENGVPGLYWITLFSGGLARWPGVDSFPRELAESRLLEGGALSVMFSSTPERCRDIEILQRQRAAIEWLGSEKFFDVRNPERQTASPDWDHLALPNVPSPA